MDPKHLQKFQTLLKEPFESGSVLYFMIPNSFDPKQELTVNSTSVGKVVKGTSANVDPPVGAVDLHTHPVGAYEKERCVWGWPSGEDVRELVRYGLKGTVAHFVVTLEGVYVMQVSPCVLKMIKNISSDRIRGMLLCLLEIYFRSLHRFRCEECSEWCKKHGKKMDPGFFLDQINHFTVDSLSYPIMYFGNSIETIPIKKWIGGQQSVHNGKWVDDVDIFDIGPNGQPKQVILEKDNRKELLRYLPKIIKEVKRPGCMETKWTQDGSGHWDKNWFHVSFFPTGKIPTFKISFDDVEGRCVPAQILFDSVDKKKLFPMKSRVVHKKKK